MTSTQPILPTQSGSAAQLPAGPPRLMPELLAEEPVAPKHGWYLPCKAALEFLATVVLSFVAAPLVLLGAVAVKLTSRGPAFYPQKRLGKNGRVFTLFKLRTMVKDAELLTGPVWAERDDPRVTPVGRILRSAHVDELPQLLNVLLGQMSLVGPRPERPELVPRLENELPHYGDRLKIRPGITGMAQLQLPPDRSVECVRRKLVYDLYYVRCVNPWLDGRILFLTFARLLIDAAKTAWHPLALPPWETVTQHVPLAVCGQVDCRENEERHRPSNRGPAASPASCDRTLIKKAK